MLAQFGSLTSEQIFSLVSYTKTYILQDLLSAILEEFIDLYIRVARTANKNLMIYFEPDYRPE